MENYQLLQDRIYSILKRKILSGGLQPGIIYSETKTAAELGVSKTPVKAAILRLSQDDFVDIIPSRGFRLRQMTQEDVIETYHVRTAIEGYCAALLSQKRDTEEGKHTILQLKELVNELIEFTDELKNTSNQEELIVNILENNANFHRVILEFSGSKKLLSIFHSCSTSILKSTSENFLTSPRMEIICSEHQKILDAICSGDEIACQRCIQQHMRSSCDHNLQIYNQNG